MGVAAGDLDGIADKRIAAARRIFPTEGLKIREVMGGGKIDFRLRVIVTVSRPGLGPWMNCIGVGLMRQKRRNPMTPCKRLLRAVSIV